MLTGLDFPADLPVAQRRDEIAAAISDHQVIVLCGETGSGKTTQVPKICLAAGRGQDGMIGHTQPRRLAARSIAARLAAETATAPGTLVGYKVRFADQTGPGCRLKLMTDGILLQELRRDRLLRAYDTLIIDEAHERSINIDFLLGYLRRLLPQRPDLRVVIMSATIDPQRFADHFGGAPVIEVSGRTYPVDVRYRPPAGGADALSESILEGITELRDDNVDGDILVFLPGERDIRDVATAVRQRFGRAFEVVPLYARLAAHQQDKVFAPGGRRRVVLATNVAETSITVPRIAAVIDSGLARISRYSHQTKIQRLPIEEISQASAQQRAGRCGRVREGICLRLYSEESFAAREPFTDPEILRTNLAGVLLRMADLGLGDIEDFPFPDPPDVRYVRDGRRLLTELQALDGERLTRIGHRLARLPLDPRLGRMLLAAAAQGSLREVTVITAALAIADPAEGRGDDIAEPDDDWRHARSEFIGLLQLWELFHRRQKELTGNQLRAWCRRNGLRFLRMREWQDLHRQLRGHCVALRLRPQREPASYADIHKAILAGMLSHIGRHIEKSEYDGARGLRFRVVPGSTIAKPPAWIVAATIRQTHRAFASQVAGVKPAWIEAVAEHLVRRSYSDPYWDSERQRVTAHESVSLYGLTLRARRPVAYATIDPRTATAVFIREGLARGRYHGNGEWLAHNRALEDELARRAAKLRRTDVLADAGRAAQFYAARMPRRCPTPQAFERWRRTAERDDPHVLFMAPDDLSANPGIRVDAREFPDVLEHGEHPFELRYRFAPGEDDDGVSLHVPVAAVAELDPARLDWLVPGLLGEKVGAIIRGLPKPLRRRLVPAPERAREFVAHADRDAPFYQELASFLTRAAGEPVTEAACRSVSLAQHLQLRIVGCDDTGAAVASARDLAQLRERLGVTLHEALALADASRWNRRGLVDWDLDRLPATVTVERQGVTIEASPGLQDTGESVDLRLFERQDQARRATRRGVARLLALRLAQQATMVRRHFARHRTAALLARTIGGIDQLSDDIVIAAITDLVGEELPRDRAAFESLRDRLRADVVPQGERLADLVFAVLESVHEHRLRLEAVGAPARADISEQLDHLVFPGFVSVVPLAWLEHYPRYLAAVSQRLDNLEQGRATRDAAAVRDVRSYWQRWLEIERQAGLDALLDPDLVAYRFMLEEYRVSVFAQQLGTAHRVSPRRLDKLLAAVQSL